MGQAWCLEALQEQRQPWALSSCKARCCLSFWKHGQEMREAWKATGGIEWSAVGSWVLRRYGEAVEALVQTGLAVQDGGGGAVTGW